MPLPKKPCKICSKHGHWTYQCPNRKRPVKRPISKGKEYLAWMEVRRRWFAENYQEFYNCYLCGKYLTYAATTLDHVIPRSNAKNYAHRHDFSNLRPCCYACNSEKGSKHLTENGKIR